MIPTGQLAVEALQLNPPKPIGFHVLVEGRAVAVLDWETVRKAHDQYMAMENIRGKNQ